jgi:predicted dehydrogenase
MSPPFRIGVAGLGYWGPNLARSFHGLAGSELVWCCDASPEARARAAAQFPAARLTARFEDLLEDPTLDAVALATPVPTHAELVVRVLEAGKHCFVEKPLAHCVADAERAVAAAERTGRTLMVGHLFMYHPAVRRLKELADSGALGEVRYLACSWVNLGVLRADENALWSLGPHEVSVLLDLVDEEPYELSARGECYVRPDVEDVVFCFLRFPSGRAAHLHLSWLHPRKERRFTVVGSRQMATFDDMAVEGKLTVYDKGFDPAPHGPDDFRTRSGGIFLPQLSLVEPLRLECEHFLEALRSGVPPRSDGHNGLRVVRLLERLQGELDRSRRAVPEHGGHAPEPVAESAPLPAPPPGAPVALGR